MECILHIYTCYCINIQQINESSSFNIKLLMNRPLLILNFSPSLGSIVRHYLARQVTAYGLSQLWEVTHDVQSETNDVFIWEILFTSVRKGLRCYISIENYCITNSIDEIYRSLISGIRHQDFYTWYITEIMVSKTRNVLNTWDVAGLIQIDESLIDSVEQVFQRKEIKQTTNMSDLKIDLSRVTVKDIHAAIIARKIIEIKNHHFGRYWNFQIFRLYMLAVSFVIDYSLQVPIQTAQSTFVYNWNDHCWPWMVAMTDIWFFTKQVHLLQRFEYEADRGAVELMVRAGYNPKGMLWLLEYQTQRETVTERWLEVLFGTTGGWFYPTSLTRRRQLALLKSTLRGLLL